MVMATMMVMAAVIPAVRDAQHALDAAHRAADARANGATHNAADRAGRTIAAISTLFRAADNALRMPGQRGCQQHQKSQG